MVKERSRFRPPATNRFGQPPAKISLYLHAFRRHWPLAITLGLFCGGAAAIAAWLLTSDRHTAVAVLRISPIEKQLVFKTADRVTGMDFEIYKGTQQQLLTSDVVLIAALRKPEAASQAVFQKEDDPVRWLARNLHVDLPLNSEIMRVSLTTSQPEEAAVLRRGGRRRLYERGRRCRTASAAGSAE